MRAREVLGEGGLLARVMPGFEPRPAQVRMAELVERALDGDGVALIEAGTGTGKTLAYLTPAALHARRIVISTGTRMLQDQILERDVPLLERALGETLPIVALKGLSNYLCLRRLEELERSGESVSRPELGRDLRIVRAWRERTRVGDLGELAELSEEAPIRLAVQSGSETRIGPRCRFYAECFVTAARRRAEQARIVVVNHHLYFADLALRAHGRGIIPDHEAVIFDEAHQIEDVATEFFGVQLSGPRIELLVRDAEKVLRAERVWDFLDAGLLRALSLRAAELFDRVARSGETDVGRARLSREVLEAGVRDALFALDADLEALIGALRERAVSSEGVAQIVRRAERIRVAIGMIAEPHRTHVAWIQPRGRSVVLGASPVDVSVLFRDEVLHRLRCIVLTSATLATSPRTSGDGTASFAFTKKRLGIDVEVDEEVLASPFDYTQQALLYLPAMPDPRDPAFPAAAAREIEALVTLTEGGAFVLCTSYRSMYDLAGRLRGVFEARGIPVLVQGEAARGAQLERFRALRDAVLFATSSFWEGVDVPGHALRLVILDKLPFEVPTDPLVQARCTRIEATGGNAFMEYLVPAAALTLKQGFGRLIRTSRDRGVVALLDSRVTTKGYGKVLLRSLPPARRVTTFAEVEAFWRRAADPAGSPTPD